MTTVIGADLSLTGTGLLTWRDGRLYAATVATSSHQPRPARHHDIVMRILAMVDPTGGGTRTLAALEQRITPGEDAVQTAMDLAELHGVVRYGLWARGVTVVDIYPTTLKLYATGSGRASKDAMMLAARGRLGSIVPVANDNEADAAFLMAAALHHYGRPLWNPPSKNLRALQTPQWPPFALDGGKP